MEGRYLEISKSSFKLHFYYVKLLLVGDVEQQFTQTKNDITSLLCAEVRTCLNIFILQKNT